MKSATFRARFIMVMPMTVLFGWVSLSTLAGAASIEAPAAPDANDSAMYSTDDIYNRLGSGAVPAKRTTGFAEPGATPGASRKNLNEIMGAAPVPDNVHGATPAEVRQGKIFWGLRTDGSWGPQTGSRFTDNGNGTVTDNQSGLIWLKNANCFGAQTWANALTVANTLNSGECGLNDSSVEGDWRLPHWKELGSLVDVRYYSPALSNTAGTGKWTAGDPFSGVQSSYYWSATTYAGNTCYAWVVIPLLRQRGLVRQGRHLLCLAGARRTMRLFDALGL